MEKFSNNKIKYKKENFWDFMNKGGFTKKYATHLRCEFKCL